MPVTHSSQSTPSDATGPKVGVVGSRDFPSLWWVRTWVTALAAKHEHATVVSGGAKGVDRTAESQAHLDGLMVVSFRVKRTEDGFAIVRAEVTTKTLPERYPTAAKALFARNSLIVAESDHVVAFHDGSSRGTADAIRKAEAAGKLSRVFTNEELVLREVDQAVADGVLIRQD